MIRMVGGLMGRDIDMTRRGLRWRMQEAGYGEGFQPADWVGRLVR